jgi:hypothetical protein
MPAHAASALRSSQRSARRASNQFASKNNDIHPPAGADPAGPARMASFIIPRFGRWLDFTIALALGLWCM